MKSSCPTHEVLAAFIDGTLDEPRSREIRAHLVACEDCYEVVSESLALAEEEAVEGELPAPGRRRGLSPAGLALAASLLAALATAWFFASRSTPAERLLAATTSRTTVARVSGLEHLPLDLTRGPAPTAAPYELLAEAGRIEKEAAQRADTQTLYALGLAQLLLEEPERAIDTFERARDTGETSWEADNDLAVALLESGLRDDQPARIARALEICTEALDRHPEQPELLFNQALALELLGLGEQAIAAWERYLTLDPDSGWADEARSRRAGLEQALPPGPGAAAVENELLEGALADWARAALHGPSQVARRALAATRRLAAQQPAVSGDPLLRAVIRAAEESPLDRELARGHLAYARARQLYAAQDAAGCAAAADTALEALETAGSRLASLVYLTAGGCRFIAGELARAGEAAATAMALERAAGEPSDRLLGQAAWLAGLVAHSEGRPAEALEAYATALRHLRAAGDAQRQGSVHALLGDLYLYLGREDDSWSETLRAVRLPQSDPARRFQALTVLTRASQRSGLVETARLAARAMVDQAAHLEDAAFSSDAWLAVGQTSARAGRPEDARAAFEHALDEARRITDPAVRERSTAHAGVELAETLLADDPRRAERLLDEAEPTARRTGDLYLRTARLRAASRRRTDGAEAIQLLRDAVRRSQREGAALASLVERDDLLAARQALYFDLVRSLVEEDRPIEALVELDTWRSEAFGIESAEALSREAVDADFGTTLLAYLSLPESLLVWRCGRGTVSLEQVSVSRRELEDLVKAFVEATQKGNRSQATLGERLGELLLPDSLDPAAEPLVIVADSVLSALPFAALPPTPGATRLIDVRQVEFAPSIRLWASRRATPPMPIDCPLLVAGATSGGATFPGLRPLLLRDREIQEIETIHGCGAVAATSRQTEDLLRRRPGLVHFVGHSIEGGDSGGALLLGSAQQIEIVDQATLETWNVDNALVVLSSCSAANGRPSSSAGRDGPTRALLSAGARAVIANLWPIDDGAALEMSERLHTHLRAGAAPAQALRATQLELIAEGRPPSAWGGWRVTGAG